MFLFFGLHNVLQEAIMSFESFTYGLFLGYLEVFGVTLCSFLESKCYGVVVTTTEEGGGEGGQQRRQRQKLRRVAPLSSYTLLTLCLLSSSGMSSMSLNYINFPTKVIFRSCKLIPAMILATFINGKSFHKSEYISALSVCSGLIVFAAADWKLTPTFSPLGIGLVSASVCADAVLPNAQERLFRTGSSRLEVTLYTNFFTLVAMTFTTLLSGDLLGAILVASRDRTLLLYMILYTAVSYLAVLTYMNVVQKFSGVTAVLLATARKGMTLVLSFLLFPKAFSWFYVSGAALVLGGLAVSSLVKQRDKKMRSSSCKAKEVEVGGGGAQKGGEGEGVV